ncbi:MAG: hypothetical protein LBM25_01135 [Bacteroidales bacterium]|jgi:hypothetical protein|nr:hypothetical protein [Bacteroidales bacterium]
MKNILKTLLFGVIAIAVIGSCSSSKNDGYVNTQKKPKTDAQEVSANRGLKLQKEECEELALKATDNLRESGNGVSAKESFATNIALLDARQKLAQQLEVCVNGLIRNFDQQHSAGKASDMISKQTAIQQAYFEQFLTNSRTICKNTYIKENGDYNVYVCVEMSKEEQKAMYKKLSEEKKIAIDFQEHQFMNDLAKAKEDYRKQRLSE